MSDLAGIKAGDQVGVLSGYGRRVRIATVDKVTPSGRIKVGDTMFRSSGAICGEHHFDSPRLAALTPEIREEARRQLAVDRCQSIRFSEVSTDALETIYRAAVEGKLGK